MKLTTQTTLEHVSRNAKEQKAFAVSNQAMPVKIYNGRGELVKIIINAEVVYEKK